MIRHNPVEDGGEALLEGGVAGDLARDVAGDPTDSEALAGLGDLARLRGDSSGAIAAYRRAIAANPSYLPARLGLADTEWASGNRANAARDYGSVVDRFPEGTYPAYVRQRADGSVSSP